MIYDRRKKTEQARLKAAGEELSSIRDQLNSAYSSFNSLSDPDLMDACIYEINSLRARYSSALKETRTLFP